MKENLKKILLAVPGFQYLCRLLTRRHVRTLMYHRFSHQTEEDERFVSADILEEQLRYIKRYHHSWSPGDQLQALHKRRSWQSCPVVITIDDGYRDFYDVAFSVFKKIGISPMLFVTTNFVAQTTLLWWDQLRLILQQSECDSVTLQLAGEDICFSLATESELQDAWSRIADHCRFMPHADKEALLQNLAVELSSQGPYPEIERYAASTWQEVREMADDGVQIGAHTLNHPILSRLSRDEAKQEIAGSKKELESSLQRPVDWFCYPQGGPADFIDETKEILSSYGFVGCYVAYQALEYDDFTLPRYCITADMKDFLWCLCGAEYLVLRLRKALGKPAALGDFYWRGSGSQAD